jgi:hypothetical protein
MHERLTDYYLYLQVLPSTSFSDATSNIYLYTVLCGTKTTMVNGFQQTGQHVSASTRSKHEKRDQQPASPKHQAPKAAKQPKKPDASKVSNN